MNGHFLEYVMEDLPTSYIQEEYKTSSLGDKKFPF